MSTTSRSGDGVWLLWLLMLSPACSPPANRAVEIRESLAIETAREDRDLPNQSAAAATPPWRFVGVQLKDAAVQNYLAQATSEPEYEEFPDYGVFASLYRDGIDLSTDTSGTIRTVIIYGPAAGKYSTYAGPMPRSLHWNMTRADVESILGPPSEQGFSRNSELGRRELFAEYPHLQMYLNYEAQSPMDMQARLIDMRLKSAQTPLTSQP